MRLFIQIVDGLPFENPLAEDNLRQLIPDFDANSLPAGLAPFERVDCPNLAGVYEKNVVSYQWVDGIVKDVWSVEKMSDDERSAKEKKLTDSAHDTVKFLKAQVAQQLQVASEADKPKWQVYMDNLNAWVLVDPTKPNIPFVAFDGSFVVVPSQDAPGSTPNVIG